MYICKSQLMKGCRHLVRICISKYTQVRRRQRYMNYCDRSDKDAVLLTSSCSAINNLIEKYHPDMLPYLLPVVTPAIAHARMLRAQYGPDVKIIYISPCVSDGGDALKDPRTKGIIDAVLDFATLREWLRSEQIKIPECPVSNVIYASCTD